MVWYHELETSNLACDVIEFGLEDVLERCDCIDVIGKFYGLSQEAEIVVVVPAGVNQHVPMNEVIPRHRSNTFPKALLRRSSFAVSARCASQPRRRPKKKNREEVTPRLASSLRDARVSIGQAQPRAAHPL
jgi:hypothetical protein